MRLSNHDGLAPAVDFSDDLIGVAGLLDFFSPQRQPRQNANAAVIARHMKDDWRS